MESVGRLGEFQSSEFTRRVCFSGSRLFCCLFEAGGVGLGVWCERRVVPVTHVDLKKKLMSSGPQSFNPQAPIPESLIYTLSPGLKSKTQAS